MPLLDRRTHPDLILTIGLFLLAAAGVTSYVIQRKTTLPESVTDPLIGLVYGVAIATALLGVYRKSRSSKGPGPK